MQSTKFKLSVAILCSLPALGAAALAPSGGDDTAAVQAAFTAGGAIALTGTLKISGTLTPANGSTITGGTLQWTGPVNAASTYAISFAGSGLAVSNVTFNGAGITLSNASAVKFTNNTIGNISGTTPNGINFTGLANSSIASNTFSNIPAIGAIFGWNPAGCGFVANRFANVGQGMHILWNNAAGKCSVSNNDVSGFSRHGIELQGDPQGLQVVGNYVHDPAAAASHIWMSIATGGETTRNDNATGVVIRGNACTAPLGFVAVPPVNYCMLEAMGNGTQVAGNYFAGGGWGGLVTDNPNMTWNDNQCHAIANGVPYTQEGPNPAIGSFNATTQAGNTSDNNWTGALPAAMAATVGPVTSAKVLNALNPAVAAATQPAGLTLVDNGDGSISGTSPTAVSQLVIAPTTPNTNYPPISLIFPMAATTFKIAGLPSQWVVSITAPGTAGSATVQSHGGPAPAGAGWNPTLILPQAPTTQPSTQPAPIYIGHSRDGNTWITDQVIQP